MRRPRVSWSADPDLVRVDPIFRHFVDFEVLPGTEVTPRQFWTGLKDILLKLEYRHRVLIGQRHNLQLEINRRFRAFQRRPLVPKDERVFLDRIGYITPEVGDFCIDTANLDREIASVAGPQLVVPVTNARYALNAANARWNSLYDAFYGTDALEKAPSAGAAYDPDRGARVIAYARDLLDRYVPLARGSHSEAIGYRCRGGTLVCTTADGSSTPLRHPDQCAGFTGEPEAPSSVLLLHHGLHIEIVIDRSHPIGQADRAGICDVVLESALTAIQDFEDSVACIDVQDKITAYRNWLGLMRGTLTATFVKGGQSVTRRLNDDRVYRTMRDGELRLPGRSLLMVRNVGAHLTTDIISFKGKPIPECFLDGLVSAAIAVHDLRGPGARRNSRTGSIYIVKPKMHGPAEVAQANELFNLIEDTLELPRHTLKMGLMDEERRTSVNLRSCIQSARHRVVFINTGFLDRTGDEIHTAMEAGPIVRKNIIKGTGWIAAYEQQNVDIGLSCGLPGRAQIGKGMWATPDLMGEMLRSKVAQLRAGANTAWVPSPTAATLHALHYHDVDVPAVQRALRMRAPIRFEELLVPPLLMLAYTEAEVDEELRNNAQGILGYTVRWVDQGIGCSKVPDINGVGLMEDRATLRISSQHIANWLRHGLCTRRQVRQILKEMALVVDRQNEADPLYRPMAADPANNIAFQAACDLIFLGTQRANGYVEPVLHARRRQVKDKARLACPQGTPGEPLT